MPDEVTPSCHWRCTGRDCGQGARNSYGFTPLSADEHIRFHRIIGLDRDAHNIYWLEGSPYPFIRFPIGTAETANVR